MFTSETPSLKTELGELLVKILHRLDRQTQKTELLAAENAELRKRVEELERKPPYTTAETATQEPIIGFKGVAGDNTWKPFFHNGRYAVNQEPLPSGSRKEGRS